MTQLQQQKFLMNGIKSNPEITVEQTTLNRSLSQHDMESEFTMVNINNSGPKPRTASPRVSVVSNQSSDTPFQLTMDEQSKVDREMNKKEILSTAPSRTVVIFKWVVTAIIGFIGLSCLVGSSLSFIEIAARLPGADNKESCSAFSTILIILMVPNMFNLFRSLWNGLRRHDMPWPSKKALNLIVLTAIMESFGVCIFAFKILPLQLFGVNGLLTTAALMFVFPIIYLHSCRHQSDHARVIAITCRTALVFLSISVGLSMAGGYSMLWKNLKDTWQIPTAVACLTVSWSPFLQKRLITYNKKTNVTDAERPETISSLSEMNEEGLITKRPQASWKSSIILSACRIPCILAFALVLHFVDSDQYKNEDAIESFRDSLDWHFEHIEPRMLFVNILCTVSGYFISLIACRITMQRGAFVLPLLLATPVVFSILSVESACKEITSILHPDNLHMCMHEKLIFNIPATICIFIALSLTFGWIIWTTNTIVLCTEAEIFWLPSFPGILLMEWLIMSRRNFLTEKRVTPQCTSRKTKVYICTTMYRETRSEMKQLLKSINRIQNTYTDKYFESHIFFDGGVKDKTPTDFALQLISLLPETLGCQVLMCTRFMTPYGMKLTWDLPTGDRDVHNDIHSSRTMKFAIHLKDNRKVKNKKRWSQIMYMSYVLDFLCKKNNDLGSAEGDDYNSFILTTDADVNFTPDSVDALLDLMICDNTVGAVCARTHPIGFGPLVWYQKFEYAIGHWFQKAAEHVLGSVLCAPGCFSVYRVRAIRDIVTTYASDVEKAFEFLTKDMGEDRWFCTLLVQSGWRIEYCATAENWTHCPEEFDEFYKQRRRWIASTIANLLLLVQEWKKISMFNYRVSLPFLIYQALLLLSTLISPSVIVLIVSGGLYYAWNLDGMATIILQCLVCVSFAMFCLFFSDTTQLRFAKLLTFLYACVMMAVAVGTAQQVVKDLENHLYGGKIDSSDISADIQISMTSLYLGSLITFFVMAGLLHPRDFLCLLHGFWYLMCLPSGYLILNIYSVCNITDRSWGTREEKEHSSVQDERTWYEMLGDKMKIIFFCCKKEDSTPNHDIATPTSSTRHRDTVMAESNVKMNHFRELFISEVNNTHETMVNTNKVNKEEKKQTAQYLPEPIPMTVDQWLDNDFRDEYGPLFKKHGFDNTLFVSGMNEKDLKNIGIRKKAHVTFLMELIQNLPEFRIEVKVPNNVLEWLKDIGLEQYFDRFEANKITTAKDLEVLKSFSRKEIETELRITKAGHLSRLLMAIKHLRNPTNEELKRIEVKRDLSMIEFFELSIINPDENAFWNTLKDACLQPGSAAFGHTEELMEKLGELRNNFLMTLAVTNTLWLILLATLATKLELKLYGTDPIGLLFLGIFESLFVIQFIGMLIHRAITLGHYCARAPYKFGQTYNTFRSWKLRDIRMDFNMSDIKTVQRKAVTFAKEGNMKLRSIFKLKSPLQFFKRGMQTKAAEDMVSLLNNN